VKLTVRYAKVFILGALPLGALHPHPTSLRPDDIPYPQFLDALLLSTAYKRPTTSTSVHRITNATSTHWPRRTLSHHLGCQRH